LFLKLIVSYWLYRKYHIAAPSMKVLTEWMDDLREHSIFGKKLPGNGVVPKGDLISFTEESENLGDNAKYAQHRYS